ncbi:hypothetical protein [Streptomyces longwoodensis]|uniref:hypothetical protein n=1 Tax=Streptomyces longwoodensis TaxID=68231 RepID=UPI003801C3B0
MTVTAEQIRRTNRLLSAGTWFLIAGVVFYSLLTTTPFVAEHTAAGWERSAPLLGLMVDVAFVMALQADSVLAQLGVRGGVWPTVFRWVTGTASVFLNTWHSISTGDWVGVAVHLIAPALLLIVAEVGPVYRRRMAEALAARAVPQGNTTVDRVDAQAVPQVSTTPRPELRPAHAKPLVICGGHLEIPAVPPRSRLGTEQAQAAIRQAWEDGLSIREAARVSTRSSSYVQKVYAQLDATRPIEGQTTIELEAA